MNTAPPAMISVQTVLQGDAVAKSATAAAPWPLLHQQHRVAAGTSIRALLCQAGLEQAIALVESGALGLACHGRRAWLDDIVVDGSRVELVEPINADAKAARAERVAADRKRRRTRFGAGR